MIGQRHVVRPYVELPLSESQNAAQDRSRVYADAHVQIYLLTITICWTCAFDTVHDHGTSEDLT